MCNDTTAALGALGSQFGQNRDIFGFSHRTGVGVRLGVDMKPGASKSCTLSGRMEQETFSPEDTEKKLDSSDLGLAGNNYLP